ncbi:MAG: hypothetical protein Q8P22_10165 [Chloroflexota bacterium]|nr:hypothetical protein [Chloroflexota bacterium]
MPPLHIQGPGEHRGSVCGLDAGERVTLQVRRYVASEELGEVLLSFDVGNGPWERTGVSLEPGQYELSAQVPSPSYAPTASYILMVPEQGVVWRADKRTFRFIRWDRAVEETGMPFCGTPGPYVPPTTPPPPPGPGIKPACGAIPTHAMVNNSEVSGSSTGLASGEQLTVSLYRLPLVVGRCYAYGFPSQEPTCIPGPEREPQESTPDTEGLELVATFETSGRRWGLAGTDLTQGRYLAVVEAEGYLVTPAAYAVDVPYMHLMSARVAGLDFTFERVVEDSLTGGTPAPAPFIREPITLEQAREVASTYPLVPTYVPDGLVLDHVSKLTLKQNGRVSISLRYEGEPVGSMLLISSEARELSFTRIYVPRVTTDIGPPGLRWLDSGSLRL